MASPASLEDRTVARTHEATLRQLLRIGWLSEQPVDFQGRMARLGRWISVRPGENLFCVGEEAGAMFGLGEGALHIAIPISDDEEVTVHRALDRARRFALRYVAFSISSGRI